MLVAVCTTNPTERYIAAIPDSRNALAGRRNATRKSRLQVPADKSSVEGTQIVSNPHIKFQTLAHSQCVAWCCDKEQERCASNVTNQCEPKIENPLHNESNSTYTSIKNMTLAGPTGVDRNLQGTAIISKNGGDGSTQTLEPNTNSNGRTNSSDGGSGEPSAGVIAGATLGGLAGLVLIVTGIIWISKGFARKKVITEFRRQQYPQSSWQERTLERGMGRSGSNVQEPPKLVTDDDMWDGGRRVFRP
jgi:hypothetical protein